jgi:hypothetical protein
LLSRRRPSVSAAFLLLCDLFADLSFGTRGTICSPGWGASGAAGVCVEGAAGVGLIVRSGPLLGGACAGVVSRMLKIGRPRFGSRIWSSGVLSPTSTVTVFLILPTSVISNVRTAALAGSATVPKPAAMPPDTAIAVSSLRLWSMCPCISPLEVFQVREPDARGRQPIGKCA